MHSATTNTTASADPGDSATQTGWVVLIAFVVLVILLNSACRASSDGVAEPSGTSATVSTVQPAPPIESVAVEEPDTSGSTAGAPTPPLAPGGEPADSDQWDYVALGDSWTGFAVWPEIYAGFIEEDLGVEVLMHDESRPRQRADDALERLRSDQDLRALLAGAEVITINFVGAELRQPLMTYARDGESCGGDDSQDCLRTALADVEAKFAATLDEIVMLRSPDEALITTFAMGVNMAERVCGEWGNECWVVVAGHLEDLFEFVTEAATDRGIRVADTATALHAPSAHAGPINDAYVQADRVHFTEEGSAVVAEVLRELGYEH